MDFRTVKEKLINYYLALRANGVCVDLIILFGSYATGEARKNSDIDVAVISRNFGKNRFNEGLKINRIASEVDSHIEAIPISLKEYFDPHSISPILYEIKTKGVPIL